MFFGHLHLASTRQAARRQAERVPTICLTLVTGSDNTHGITNGFDVIFAICKFPHKW